jgi:hypothetical protein
MYSIYPREQLPLATTTQMQRSGVSAPSAETLTEVHGGFVARLFEDKRMTSAFLVVWLLVVLACFADLGVMESKFIAFGPTEHTWLMGIAINTWRRWWCVAGFTFVNTAINDFVGDSVVPWIVNVLQDPKTRYLPYSKFTCWSITQTYSVYVNVMSIFGIHLLLSQLDFMLIRMLADGIVNVYTTYTFMAHKKVNRGKYYEYKRRAQNGDSDDETEANELTELAQSSAKEFSVTKIMLEEVGRDTAPDPQKEIKEYV